jgi:hypothetical protein
MAEDTPDLPACKDPDSSKNKKKIVALACERFKLAQERTDPQRKRESEDLAFDAGEQWTDEVKDMRSGKSESGQKVPDRPMLTIPKLDQPVALVINQMKAAHLGIQIHPVSEDADDDTAEVIQGLIRAIEVKSRANLARAWAFERAVKAGRGFYRILTEPCTDYPPDSNGPEVFDQDIVVKRILNQSNVFLDPFAQEPDWSDGEWGFIVERMSEEKYQRLYGKSKLAKYQGAEWDTVDKDWTSYDNGKRTIQVAEYFVVVTEKKTKVRLTNGQILWKADLPEGTPDDAIEKEAEIETRSVRWYKLNGVEILDEQEWNGRYIPIIPVLGREQNIDGERRFVGVIGPAKDGQRLFNYSVSQAVESAALEPKAPFVAVEGSFEGHEKKWEQANTRNFAYLEYRGVSLNGQPAPPPQRNTTISPNTSISLELARHADDFIKSATFAFDPSLGNTSSARSGKAVLALQSQADAGNSHYLDNLAMAMTYEAKVILDLLPSIYDRPGRVARITGKDDEESTVVLNQPYVQPAQGRPQPVPQGQALPPKAKHFDLKRGVYMTTVTIGKSFQTRLQAGADALGTMLQAMPNLFPMLGWRWAKYSDYPGHDEVAEDLKKLRPPELQDDKGQADPKQLQMQLQQAQQMFEQMKGEIAKRDQFIQTEQAKHQAAIEQKKLEVNAKIQIEQMNNATALAVAKINAATKGYVADNEAEVERLALAQDAEQYDRDRAHEVATQAMDQQHAMTQQVLTPPPEPPTNGNGGAL